jgi:hypothetical protein
MFSSEMGVAVFPSSWDYVCVLPCLAYKVCLKDRLSISTKDTEILSGRMGTLTTLSLLSTNGQVAVFFLDFQECLMFSWNFCRFKLISNRFLHLCNYIYNSLLLYEK